MTWTLEWARCQSATIITFPGSVLSSGSSKAITRRGSTGTRRRKARGHSHPSGSEISRSSCLLFQGRNNLDEVTRSSPTGRRMARVSKTLAASRAFLTTLPARQFKKAITPPSARTTSRPAPTARKNTPSTSKREPSPVPGSGRGMVDKSASKKGNRDMRWGAKQDQTCCVCAISSTPQRPFSSKRPSW
jgi:hypothetical protein